MVCNYRNGGNNAGKKKLTVTEADRSMNVFIEEGYLQVFHCNIAQKMTTPEQPTNKCCTNFHNLDVRVILEAKME